MIKFIYLTDEGGQAPMSVFFDSIEDAYIDLCLNDWEPDEVEYEGEEE